MRYTHVVMSGGSFKCLTTLGCLRYHEHAGHLEDVHCFVGVSAGAMLGLLLGMGCSTDEIIKFVYQDLIPCALKGIELEAVLNLAEVYGLDDGSAYTSMLQKIAQSKGFNADLTFGELLEKTGKRLVVGVTNVATHSMEYWDVDSHSETSVLTAVRASLSIPLLFTPVWHQGSCYVDGGVLNNFPLAYVPTEHLSTTLAIHIVNQSQPTRSRETELNWSMLDYVRELLTTVTYRPMPPVVCDTLLTIAVDEPTDHSLFCFAVETLKFEVTTDIARQYVQQGYSVAKCNYETRVKHEKSSS